MNAYTFIKLYLNKCTIPLVKIRYLNGLYSTVKIKKKVYYEQNLSRSFDIKYLTVIKAWNDRIYSHQYKKAAEFENILLIFNVFVMPAKP